MLAREQSSWAFHLTKNSASFSKRQFNKRMFFQLICWNHRLSIRPKLNWLSHAGTLPQILSLCHRRTPCVTSLSCAYSLKNVYNNWNYYIQWCKSDDEVGLKRYWGGQNRLYYRWLTKAQLGNVQFNNKTKCRLLDIKS